MHKNAFFTVILIFVIMTQQTIVFASNIDLSAVNRLDLKKGRIAGQQAPYTLFLPTLWAGYLVCEKENISDNKGILEKLNFYYEPIDKLAKPVFFLSFYVYDSKYWRDSSNLRKLIETEDYVFAIKSAEENPFKNTTDFRLFDVLLTNAKNDDFFIKMITLPDSIKIITRNVTLVNDNPIEPKTVFGSDGVLYIPLRATCEALGYLVGWDTKKSAVLLIKGDFTFSLTTKNTNKKYKVLVANDMTYVSSMFFIQVLNLNVEIDKNNNAYITA